MNYYRERLDTLLEQLDHTMLPGDVYLKEDDLETLKGIKRAIKTIEQVMDERRIYVEQLEKRNSELESLLHHYRIILNAQFGKPRNCSKCEYNDTDSIIVNRLEQLEKENKELKKDLESTLNCVLGAFENNWYIDWNFTDIREKYKLGGNQDD